MTLQICVVMLSKDRWDIAAVLINGSLALIGMGGILVALRTLNHLARQTYASEQSAEAALRSATAANRSLERYVSRERARIAITPRFVQFGEIAGSDLWSVHTNVEVRNVGASSAFVTRKEASMIIRAVNADERGTPDGAWLCDLKNGILDSGQEASSTSVWMNAVQLQPDEIARRIMGEESEFELTGFVEFETLGEKWRRTFSFRYDMQLAKMLVDAERPLPFGNILLLGHWVERQNQNLGEHRWPR